MLVQIAHAHPLGPLHLALVGLQLPGNNVHKRGFALPVCPHKADVLTL